MSPENRTWLTQRRQEVGEQAWQNAIEQWPELSTAVRAEMGAGTDPADTRVQELTRRWDELPREFLDDNAEVCIAAGHAWQAMWDQHADIARGSPLPSPSRPATPERHTDRHRAPETETSGRAR